VTGLHGPCPALTAPLQLGHGAAAHLVVAPQATALRPRRLACGAAWPGTP